MRLFQIPNRKVCRENTSKSKELLYPHFLKNPFFWSSIYIQYEINRIKQKTKKQKLIGWKVSLYNLFIFRKATKMISNSLHEIMLRKYQKKELPFLSPLFKLSLLPMVIDLKKDGSISMKLFNFKDRAITNLFTKIFLNIKFLKILLLLWHNYWGFLFNSAGSFSHGTLHTECCKADKPKTQTCNPLFN